MAKIKRGYYSGSRAKRSKKLNVAVTVQSITGQSGFEACATFGRTVGKRRGPAKSHDERSECAVGKNPRKAIAAALRGVANAVASRSGAFAGFGKKGY